MRQIAPLWNRVFRCALFARTVAFCALAAGGTAQADQIGSASGLPVPRYVSLKSDRVNLREGPSKDHRTIWIFQRAGLPVEITAEFEIWRKVRDSEGAEGWVLHSLLSGRRTALVTP
ncbi:MAG: SH3 domain-containing protein, partial [Methylocella sp.]